MDTVVARLKKHTTIDAFLDQTFHVWAHGGSLTELDQLIVAVPRARHARPHSVGLLRQSA
jgi:hypothetical protein